MFMIKAAVLCFYSKSRQILTNIQRQWRANLLFPGGLRSERSKPVHWSYSFDGLDSTTVLSPDSTSYMF